MFNFFKKKNKEKIERETNKYIDLKEFIEIRKNIKTNYTNIDIINYCYELFIKDFKESEQTNVSNIKIDFANCEKTYKYIIGIDLNNITRKFVGITILEILKILKEDKTFKNNLEIMFRQLMTEEVLKEITTKIEYECNIDRTIEYIKNKHIMLSRFDDLASNKLFTTFILYFKYD